MDIHERAAGPVPVLELRGRLTLESFGRLKNRVREVVESGTRHVVLDLAAVPYVDSIGVAELVRSHVMLRNVGGRLVLASVPGQLTQLLELTRLDQVVESYPSQTEAVNALRAASV
ncbi:MAG TPA: anti-sigma factor antagonist [Acidobacteria bacterium]|jgi:anti-sigma B factor antagonist|nr:anti-sigma factor antagonist [Acidobacteriota bacterium]